MDQPQPPGTPDQPGAPDASGPRPSRKAVLRAALAAGVALPTALVGVPALARTARDSDVPPELTPSCDDATRARTGPGRCRRWPRWWG
ncbi:hypothetical protein SSPIM334S_07695 [Streptomyces spiroverticillatus]